MSLHRIKRFTYGFLLLVFPVVSHATHLRGGEITVRTLQCGAGGYEITLTLYTNTNTLALPGGGILSFGDGSTITLPDLNNTIIDAQYRIGKAVYVVVHNYQGPGTYLIGYSEANRNGGILNFQNSELTPFYVESQLVINGTFPCNNPISFTIAPVDKACAGNAFSHNPGAKDLDGDSISFELVTPKRTSMTVVDGYKLPNNISFYNGLNYQQANEAKTSTPSFTLDFITGNLFWDAPGNVGQYEIAIKVSEWKKSNGIWFRMGYVERDIQIIVEDCHDTRPILQIPNDVCVTPGDNIAMMIRGFDADFDPVKIEVFTSDNFQDSAPDYKYSGLMQSTKAPFDTAKVIFNWSITCNHVRDQPYIIVFKVTDLTPSGIRLSSFFTWKITVIGAAPQYQGVTLDLATKTLRIDWQSYPCPNAPVMEVWRRVDGAQVPLDNCSKGLSRAMGFVKIGSVSGSSFYDDKDLNPGAKYCYRLLAVYQTPYHSVSRPSVETCIGPIIVDAPVITLASAVKTDKLQGQVKVGWTSPFQINKLQFPPPYEYEVYRTNDGVSFAKVSAQRVSDTTFVDRSLNTTALNYGYKIVVYSPSGLTHENPVDTSALAFFPRLAAESEVSGIYLHWDAQVPWSNQSQKYPWHYIFRADTGPFKLIDSVDVNGSPLDYGFDYFDKGDKQPLQQNTVYTYRVRTSGVYGNDQIDPLRNDSNEIQGQTKDISPPCQTELTIQKTDCENFIKNSSCEISDFKNLLNWQYPPGCGNDVAEYKVLFKDNENADFTELATTSELTYTHSLQNSFSGCYKIVAVDRSGNTGKESETACNENCPSVFIPNVFTPENADGLNDSFPGIAGGNLKDPQKCPRFVNFIDIRILNRWGQEVFSIYEPLSKHMKEWRGLDNNGNELPSGIYYYEGSIGVNVMDESNQKQKLKGWVNLIR